MTSSGRAGRLIRLVSALAITTGGLLAVLAGPASASPHARTVPTTCRLSALPQATAFGQDITLVARVSSAEYPQYEPAGTVTFLVGTTRLGTRPLADGTAVLDTGGDASSPPPVGADTITAVYGGDPTAGTGGCSATVTVQVGKADTATTVTSSADPSAAGQLMTFTVTVKGNISEAIYDPPTGEVTVTAGALAAHSLVLKADGPNAAVASFTASLSSGSSVIQASYPGDATFNGSAGQLIQRVN